MTAKLARNVYVICLRIPRNKHTLSERMEKEKKATGSDGIPSKALKIGANELSAPLTTLFNSCINKTAWPSKWKCGHWAPVYVTLFGETGLNENSVVMHFHCILNALIMVLNAFVMLFSPL